MIEKIDFIKYRKLEKISIPFTNGVNLISGTNGTCKSSILHILSNSFQEAKPSNAKEKECLSIISRINQLMNPKINNLTKGDREYNDPAPGIKGSLFKVKYSDNTELNFRRHNARSSARFSLKPEYVSPGESLPALPVIYLGLTRLIPIGELIDEYTTIRKSLPESYQAEIIDEYRKLTGISIQNISNHEVTGIKKRSEFISTLDGIDSNTISAGEDNLFIILNALYSLKYYAETTDKPSLLLIDEIDATLHPSLQYKLFILIKNISERFKIQVVFTSHSLYLLNKALNSKCNVHYLIKSISSISLMPSPDIFKIEMQLNSETRQNLYQNKKIPIFSEDPEARIVITMILDYLAENDTNFASVRSLFHLVEMSSGCDNLKTLFNDKVLTSTILKAICILDGDTNYNSLKNNSISLPGGESPEKIAFEHLELLITDPNRDDFWLNDFIMNEGFSLEWAIQEVSPETRPLINQYEREKAKKVFNDENHHDFLKIILKDWIYQNWDSKPFKGFLKDFSILFHNIAPFYGIPKERWPIIKN